MSGAHREMALPPWLEAQARLLEGMLQRSQLPQSLLVHGSAGSGRRRLGLWLAARLLGTSEARLLVTEEAEAAAPGHPDLLQVDVAPEKTAIVIDQVRDLIGFLQLKSHQGGARVVLVTQADAMNANAANSLLKTLEEPPAGSTIILLATHLARLPATIVSRCHRLRLGRPPPEMALAWLRPFGPEVSWADLLDFAGGAPLLARAMEQRGFVEQAAGYEGDLQALGAGRASPGAVARRWARAEERDLALRWLYWRIGSAIRRLLAGDGAASGPGVLQKPAEISKIQALFAQLRAIEELRRHRAKALNFELQIAALLATWWVDPLGRASMN